MAALELVRDVAVTTQSQEAATAEEQSLITDLFERITLFDLRVEKPIVAQRPDGKWDVVVPVAARKLRADGKGKESEAPLHALISVGLFTADPSGPVIGKKDVLRMDQQGVRSGRQIFHFVTDRKPTHAGIDPLGLYIDRNTNDNIAPVEERTRRAS